MHTARISRIRRTVTAAAVAAATLLAACGSGDDDTDQRSADVDVDTADTADTADTESQEPAGIDLGATLSDEAVEALEVNVSPGEAETKVIGKYDALHQGTKGYSFHAHVTVTVEGVFALPEEVCEFDDEIDDPMFVRFRLDIDGDGPNAIRIREGAEAEMGTTLDVPGSVNYKSVEFGVVAGCIQIERANSATFTLSSTLWDAWYVVGLEDTSIGEYLYDIETDGVDFEFTVSEP